MKYIKLLLLLSIFFTHQSLANDGIIYANEDGSYTYFGNIYSFEDFPISDVVIAENTVQIFPTNSQLKPGPALTIIRPLARKFLKSGYNVETKLFGQVVPYRIKKTGQ